MCMKSYILHFRLIVLHIEQSLLSLLYHHFWNTLYNIREKRWIKLSHIKQIIVYSNNLSEICDKHHMLYLLSFSFHSFSFSFVTSEKGVFWRIFPSHPFSRSFDVSSSLCEGYWPFVSFSSNTNVPKFIYRLLEEPLLLQITIPALLNRATISFCIRDEIRLRDKSYRTLFICGFW